MQAQYSQRIMKIMPILDMKKQTQFKPNSKPIQTQNKHNSRKDKNDTKCAFTKDYEQKCGYGPKKTKPKQTQSNPIFIPLAEAFVWCKERNFGKMIMKPINCFCESVMKRIFRKFIS